MIKYPVGTLVLSEYGGVGIIKIVADVYYEVYWSEVDRYQWLNEGDIKFLHKQFKEATS